MGRTCNVALVGQGFMGRAHSNAYLKVGRFFDLPREPVMHTVAGRDRASLEAFARRWGWRAHTVRWRDLAAMDEVDLVDVATPNDLHADQCIAMLEAGKHVACEKPLAHTLEAARAMRRAAVRAPGRTFVWFNYRRCPALALAYRLARRGRLGRIRQVRASYLQSWGGPEAPLAWRFRRRRAGSGAHGDLSSHLVDLARFLTGDEVVEVSGAASATFVPRRPRPGARGGGRSDVDDCLVFLARFRGGAVASFEASRVATGHQNALRIEVHGSEGAIRFDFEDMNLLWFHDVRDDPAVAGWRRIMCTRAGEHPYAGAWWPDAHLLGYEHGFVNMAADVLRVLGGRRPEVPLADFADAYETQRVLEAALLAARNRCSVRLSEVR